MKKVKSNKVTNPKVIAELRSLADDNDGLLTPDVVVEAARSPHSSLHGSFTWDNSKAAHKYRLWQARRLLRVVVEFMPSIQKNVRVFVSLTPDRQEESGGYRTTVDVLTDTDRRAQLLADAMSELRYFQQKYGMLKELAGVWKEINKIKNRKG